ncbi:hypothetical protein BLSMQ_3528 [Brevibacterium aurantiacum]|uniref:Uncharacterized protein n=1 Tax=Brevibacterium aurantiacum TaxID=273384 RepID=A0A1D7W971_BREAU|nr:hypothetical protein BLSMQ_3528 [Brevibacterium aurantiacum]
MRICSAQPDANDWVQVAHPGMPTQTGFVGGYMHVDYLELLPTYDSHTM